MLKINLIYFYYIYLFNIVKMCSNEINEEKLNKTFKVNAVKS